MNKPIIIAIMGKSCVGKDSLAKVLPLYFTLQGISSINLISDTTRPMRPKEEQGKDYNFISKEQFHKNLQDNLYVEYDNFRGWYYGTNIDSISNIDVNIGIFTLTGMLNIWATGKYNVVPIYLDVDFFTRMRRYKQRAGKWTYEQFRRAFFDFVNFSHIYEMMKAIGPQSLVLKNSKINENCAAITQHLVSLGLVYH